LAVTADVTAVVGWRTEEQTTLLLIGAALALSLGLVLIARQWGKALGAPAMIGLGSVAVGMALGTVAVVMLTGPQPTPTSVTGGGRPTTSASAPTTDPTTATATTPTTKAPHGGKETLLEVRLDPGTGADVDTGERKGKLVTGAVGPVDLFLAPSGLLFANGTDFYSQTDILDNAVLANCAEAVAARVRPEAQVLPVSPLQRYCFTTSDGRVAWLRPKQVAVGVELVLSVRVAGTPWRRCIINEDDLGSPSPDGHTLATGSLDQTVRLWNVADPAHPTPVGPPLPGHTDSVYGVVFSPDGRTLASASDDQTVRLWNAADRPTPPSLGPPLTGHTNVVHAVAFSPMGRTVKLTLIMIYFAKATTRYSGHTRQISWHFVVA
jgi:WD domain, G-beta repeat